MSALGIQLVPRAARVDVERVHVGLGIVMVHSVLLVVAACAG